MKARKLPSGNWNIQVFMGKDKSGKKMYRSITAATKDEAELQALRIKTERAATRAEHKKRGKPDERTVREIVNQYIEDCEDPIDREPLSPSTISGYRKNSAEAFPELMSVRVCDLTEEMCQAAIKAEKRRISSRTKKQISAKTIKNEWLLVSAALRRVCGISYHVTLPTVRRPVKVLPPPSEIIAAVVGTKIELPCLLSMWMSLRQSEVLALDEDSIQGGRLVIDKALINGKIQHRTKTSASMRALPIPSYIQKLIDARLQEAQERGEEHPVRLVTIGHDALLKRLQIVMQKKGYEITYHDLRHIFATVSLSSLGLPEKEVQTSGGWASPVVMQGVYSNVTNDIMSAADKAREDYWMNLILDVKTE